MLDKIKGLSVKVKVLLGVACVAVVGIAGVGISANVQESRLIEKNLYMSLRYLEANDADMASDYLQDVGEEGNKKQRFVKDTAEIVCQQIKGNETLWRIRMNMLETDYEMDLDQRAIATYLEQGTENAYIDYSVVLQQMLQYLGIADKRLIVYGDEYGIVSTAMNSGYLSPEQRDAYKNLYSEEKMKNLVLGVALSNGDYYTALYEAIAMVNEDASEENRILLADVIARAAYAGYNVDESYFMSYWGEEYNAEAQAKAKEKLEKKLLDVEEKIANTEFKMATVVNGEELTKMNEDLQGLEEEKTSLENRLAHEMVYRAMNSLYGIHSLESKVVMAKLQYAVEQPEAAMNTLLAAADSWEMTTSNNETIKQGLRIISNLEDGQSYASQAASSYATEMLTDMFEAVNHEIPVKQREGYYAYNIADDLSGMVVAEYKYVDSDIYISSIDDSNFPDITLTVNAREEILNDIVKKKNVVVKDTHYEVKYNAVLDETITPTICFVVDISGSMDGTPIENAKAALDSFADTLNQGTEIALVSFDNWGYLNVPVTTDVNQFKSEAAALYGGGGTDITAGIDKGIEALESASGVKNIILMTDGQSYIDESIIHDAVNQNIKIFTVGFGDVDSSLLENIAKQTGGTFTLADSSGDLAQVYESIGAVIGHSAKITYTVKENAEEASRYAFIDAGNYNASKKKEYGALTTDRQKDDFAMNYYYYCSMQDMNAYGNNSYAVYFDTTKNDNVESIVLNGITYKGEANSGSVYTEISPITKEGLYDVTFNFTDGSSYTVEDGFLVYDETVQYTEDYSSGVRIGGILIYTDNRFDMSDGTVVLAGARFAQIDSDYTLDARTNNFVVLENITKSTDYYGDLWYFDYGETGSFHMDGTLSLTSYDAQNVSGYDTGATVGKVIGTIDQKQFSISRK